MKKRYKIIQVIICIFIVAAIMHIKLSEHTSNNGGDRQPEINNIISGNSTPKEEELESSENGDIPKDKEIKERIKTSTAAFCEECEECGMYYIVKSVKQKSVTNASGERIQRFIILCHIKNGRRNEKIKLQEVAKKFSIIVGETENNGVLTGSKKILDCEEECDLKIKVDFNEMDTEYYKVYYTFQETDDDNIMIFKTEFIE